MIVAKPVIPNQYWILREDDRKVGNIEASADGFTVKINNQIEKYKTIHTIKREKSIDFEIEKKSPPGRIKNQVHGYPTTSRPYNGIYDVKHQVPLWTQEPRSKSWYAAGWYAVQQGRRWEVVECPKLIMLERYKYQGPFLSKDEAVQTCCT
jgi:hypothetical protein